MKVEVGDTLPPWTMESVCPARMRTVAAILRDPNPVHWDRGFVASRGGGDRVINQTPVNVGYIANMLMAWAGPGTIRRIRVEFPDAVFEGDRVTARGVVRELSREGDLTLAECDVWLEKEDGRRAVEGFALVVLPS
ncbi:MAG: protein dehydratase [Deltaproteobacteria bacterium]|nr:protein dehydratase [Deltaproteobacteria bacterium]MBW2420555.1 protein dehydratase [Deltaproteobacteria bacterium]